MNHRHAQPKLKVVRRKRAPAASDPTREKLLTVAGRVFAARGYQATTVREICSAAGANVAAVNYHFGDKFGLYTEVLQQSVRAAQVEAIQNALDQNAPPEDIFRAVIRARLRAISVMGQILAYVFAGPLLAGVWPDLKLTPEQVERIADHIGDFSLAYLQDFRSKHEAITPVREPRVSK